MVVWIGKKMRPKLPHRRAAVKPGNGLLQSDSTLPDAGERVVEAPESRPDSV